MIDEIFEDLKDRMGKSIESLKREYSRLRTGRASISLLDGIKVSYYDTLTPLNQMASLAVPEPRLIVIQPWDKTAIEDCFDESGAFLSHISYIVLLFITAILIWIAAAYNSVSI